MALGQARYAEINRMLSETLEKNRCLIAVHRGSWGGNITQNTVGAYKAAFGMGADMVEADVNSTTDGVLYAFHDGHEPDVFGVNKCIKQMTSAEVESLHPLTACRQPADTRISRLDEILDYLPEGKLLNIDRAWDIFPQLVEALDRHPNAIKKVVIKAPLKAKDAIAVLNNHPVKYMFMPICYTMQDVEEALAFPELNVVGCEVIAFDRQSEMFADESIAAIHAKNLYVWVNAIVLGNIGVKPLYGELDDDVSILKDPALGWGALFDKKIDIIQTDWPALLWQYRHVALGV